MSKRVVVWFLCVIFTITGIMTGCASMPTMTAAVSAALPMINVAMKELQTGYFDWVALLKKQPNPAVLTYVQKMDKALALLGQVQEDLNNGKTVAQALLDTAIRYAMEAQAAKPLIVPPAAPK